MPLSSLTMIILSIVCNLSILFQRGRRRGITEPPPTVAAIAEIQSTTARLSRGGKELRPAKLSIWKRRVGISFECVECVTPTPIDRLADILISELPRSVQNRSHLLEFFAWGARSIYCETFVD